MDRRSEISSQIRELVKEYFTGATKEKFILGKTRIPLMLPPFSWEEVNESIDSLLSTQLTMGVKVKRFESMFAQYIGVRSATMVHSGSSANLLALSILTNPILKNRIKPGDEVITPAITWATTVWPIINCGAVPVLVDVDLDTFNISAGEIEKAITPKTRAIMLVHLLGNPCDMDKITSIAKKHNLYIVEDSCEAHGAEFDGKKLGSFGDLATFSFFFSHHITTIEGGMVMTNNEEFAELSKSLRVFGWVRDLKAKDKIAAEHKDIDPRFLFVNIGYNLRPTEVEAAFGLHQLGKLDNFIEIRRDNARFWAQNLAEYKDHLILQSERKVTRHVWFGYPITILPGAPFTRKEMMDFLESKGVETRPIMSGNIDEQPGMALFNYRKIGELKNARLIMRNSFFFGNHQGVGEEEREAIVTYFNEFISKRVK
ncbi:DegT/DnrJ/EryC1/StrS family aminotransferase [Chloroflexota bacterium]